MEKESLDSRMSLPHVPEKVFKVEPEDSQSDEYEDTYNADKNAYKGHLHAVNMVVKAHGQGRLSCSAANSLHVRQLRYLIFN